MVALLLALSETGGLSEGVGSLSLGVVENVCFVSYVAQNGKYMSLLLCRQKCIPWLHQTTIKLHPRAVPLSHDAARVAHKISSWSSYSPCSKFCRAFPTFHPTPSGFLIARRGKNQAVTSSTMIDQSSDCERYPGNPDPIPPRPLCCWFSA